MNQETLTRSPFGELDLSKEFREKSERMGFRTLQDILLLEPIELTKKKEFDYNWLGELITFLQKHDALALLQPLPGSKAG